jgi:hypothetical protein
VGTEVGAACAAVIVLRAATAPNSPAIFFSMMSLQMPSASPRVGRKREKAAISSWREELSCHVAWPQWLRQIDLAAASGWLFVAAGRDSVGGVSVYAGSVPRRTKYSPS